MGSSWSDDGFGNIFRNGGKISIGPSPASSSVPVPGTGLFNVGTNFTISPNTLSTGPGNIGAGLNSLVNNSTGRFNTAYGTDSLANNSTGQDNTALGFFALPANTAQISAPLVVGGGVSYRSAIPNDRSEKSLGLIAQEVEKILPEVVSTLTDKRATKVVDYMALTAVLIEGIKAQQTYLEIQQAKLQKQQYEIEELKELIYSTHKSDALCK